MTHSATQKPSLMICPTALLADACYCWRLRHEHRRWLLCCCLWTFAFAACSCLPHLPWLWLRPQFPRQSLVPCVAALVTWLDVFVHTVWWTKRSTVRSCAKSAVIDACQQPYLLLHLALAGRCKLVAVCGCRQQGQCNRFCLLLLLLLLSRLRGPGQE